MGVVPCNVIVTKTPITSVKKIRILGCTMLKIFPRKPTNMSEETLSSVAILLANDSAPLKLFFLNTEGKKTSNFV